MHSLPISNQRRDTKSAGSAPATKFVNNGTAATADAKNEMIKSQVNPGRVRLPGLPALLPLLVLLFSLLSAQAAAQTLDKLQGLCTRGGQNIRTAGASSSEKAEMVVPSCTVTVYIAGTLTPATIYSDRASTPTPKANPFTANSAGEWFFYAGSGRYDIRFSGGTGPGAYPAPVTYGDWGLSGTGAAITDYRGAINAKVSFGCAGDGVTNDSVCIQNALTAAAGTNGKIVYFPAGTYLTDEITQSLQGITIVGDGPLRSILKARIPNSPVFNVTGPGLTLYTTIEEIGIQGQGKTSGSAGHCAVFGSLIPDRESAFFTIRNVKISNCGGKGLWMPGQFTTLIEGVTTDEIGDNHIEIQGGNTTTLVRCYVQTVEANRVGYRIFGGDVTMIGNNGMDPDSPASAIWGLFGAEAGADGYDSYFRGVLNGNNIESFGDYGIYFRDYSWANFSGNAFTTYTAGNHIAVRYGFVDPPTGQGVWTGNNRIILVAGAWTNGQPIHSRGTPFSVIGTQTITAYYDTGLATTVSFPTNVSMLVPGSSNSAVTISRAKFGAIETSNLVGDLVGATSFTGDAGRIRLQDGTAGRPTYSNTTNAGNGMYFPGGAGVAFAVGQNLKLDLTASHHTLTGNLGINTFGNSTYALDLTGGPARFVNSQGGSSPTLSLSSALNTHLLVTDTGPAFPISVRLGTLQGGPDRGFVGTMTTHPFDIYQNGLRRWTVDTLGDLIPNGVATAQLGNSINPTLSMHSRFFELHNTINNNSTILQSTSLAQITISLPDSLPGAGNECLQISSLGAITRTGSACGSGGGAGVTSLAGTANQITASAATGAVTLSLAGPHNFTTATANGVAYGNGTGPILFTAAGGVGTLCLTSTNGAAPVWGACAGSAATAWDALTAPGSANLSLNMGTFLTTFTWATGTGSNNLFNLATANSSNGTGYLLNVATGTSSTVKPLNVTAQGSSNGVEMTTAGALVAKGSGRIEATPPGTTGSIPYNNGAGLFDGAANAILDIASSTIILGTSSSQNGQLQLRNSTNAFTTTIAPGVPGANNTLTLPATTDTLVGIAAAQTFTNKTLTSSTNVLGGVTMTLGSDADGDLYWRNGGVLTRLPKGTALQGLRMNAGATAPEWAAISASAALTATYVGYGDGANLLTGSTRLTWDNTNRSLILGESANTGQVNITLRSSNTSSAIITDSTAGRPGSQGGIIFSNTGGDQTQGPGLTWSNGAYNNTSRLYLSLGLNFQGYDTAGQSLLIRKTTATSAQGSNVFEFRPNDGYAQFSPFSTSSGNTTEIRQLELAANGTNYFATKAADSIATTYTLVWPTDVPVAGDRLAVTALTGSTITTEWLAGSGGSGTVTNTGTLTSGKALLGNGGVDLVASRLTLTNPATTATFTLADNKTFTVNNSITFTGTDSTTLTLPAISDTLAGIGTSNTFTVQQTITGGTTSGADRLLMTVTALGSNGTRSSPNIIQRGSSYDGSAHTVDWRFRTVPTTNAGASQWELQSRIDAASYVTNLQIDDTGLLTITDAILEGGNLVLNDVGLSRADSTLLEVNDTALGNYLDLKVRQYHADATISATAGNQTINKALFSFVIGAGTSNAIITNSFVTTSSLVICTPQRKDTTLLTVAAEPAAGSVTITGNAGATANTAIACMVFNN